jgi:N-acetylmuramoyl-L-alanine amidase
MADLNIKNHRFDSVPFNAARWVGDTIKPEVLICHDTAGRLDKGNSARYLQSNPSKTSVHLVLERDGSIEQQVAFNNRANHAGKSRYNGRDWCNNFTIGVEIVNPGKMVRGKPGFARAWYGQEFNIEEYGIQWLKTDQHGEGYFMPYTEEQIAGVEKIAVTLFAKYPSLTDIQTHWYISPGRKIDTNPLFPLEQIRSRVMGREDFADKAASDHSVDLGSDVTVQINAPGDTLNMRRWPSFNPNIIGEIPHATIVPVLRSGEFAGREWSLVVYGGKEGWVVDSYLTKNS